MVDALPLAVVEDGGGVVGIDAEVDEPDDGRDVPPCRRLLHAFECCEIVAHEAPPERQILGRVARDREFREGDEIGSLGFRRRNLRRDRAHVAVEVPDCAVDLR